MVDYVVVGAGAAGCVLAHRLSADPEVQVVLLEAGPTDDDPMFRVPSAGGGFFRTRYDWDLDTQPEPACGGRRVYLPQARVLGGGSAVNGMAYVRGAPGDYDDWGRPGWGFEDLLPYFLRAEDNERGPSPHHGVGGPVRVSDSRAHNPSALAFLRAALDLGHAANPDFNGPSQLGFGTYQVTQRDGVRASSASAYLRPVADRENLQILTGVEVHRVLVEGGRAVGVAAHLDGRTVEIRAEREVVLAAGAYASPRLLLQSGIGEAGFLESYGIPVVADVPDVGRHLQDHPHVWLSFVHDEPVSLLAAGAPASLAQYEADRSGPATLGGPETGGFVSLGDGTDADLQFLCLPMQVNEQFLSPPAGHGLSFGASVMKPRSRGEVSLYSPVPTAKPRVVQNYLSDPADLDAAVEGIRLSLEIAGSAELRPYTTRPTAVPASGSEADLRAFARAHVVSGHHPVGTCGIGRVVDDELRVHGVAGLRVVDASVMPSIVRGNTNAPVVAIAEKAADLVTDRPLLGPLTQDLTTTTLTRS